MGIDMVDILHRQHPAHHGIRFARLSQCGIDHHSIAIERPEREDSAVECRRDFIVIGSRLKRALANEDRMAGTIRIVAVVRDMVDQQQRLSGLRIVKLDTARESGLAVSGHARRAVRGQLLVTKADKMGELVGLNP